MDRRELDKRAALELVSQALVDRLATGEAIVVTKAQPRASDASERADLAAVAGRAFLAGALVAGVLVLVIVKASR